MCQGSLSLPDGVPHDSEIAARLLSPIDLVDEYLARIKRPGTEAARLCLGQRRQCSARRRSSDKAIRAGRAVGPLHGFPIAIKDLVEIEGDVAMGGTAHILYLAPL
jgi:aspartyl-tRNA(Asn)/glutamyl-tRNA(Gln) amidotransferase subunit A